MTGSVARPSPENTVQVAGIVSDARGLAPHGHGGKFDARGNAELAEDAGDVPLNGAARQVQAGGDGWVGQSFGDQAGHDPFSFGK
jgi:hypothetical protein